MSTNRCFQLVLCALFSLSMMASAVRAQGKKEGGFSAWVERQKARCAKMKAAYQGRINKMKKAMEQAQNALKFAQDEKDTEAASIAQRAIDISQNMIARLEGLILGENSRIATVERMGRIQTKGHFAAASVIKGKVTKISKKKRTELDPNTPIKPGDQISTGPDGFVELMSTDGTSVQLDKNSSYTIVKQGKNLSVYKLRSGRIHKVIAQTKKLLRRSFKVLTPYVVAAVRGTTFQLEVDGKKSSTLMVMEGEVELSPIRGKKKVKVKKGEKATIDAKGKITGPEPFEPKSIKKWWEVTQ